MIPSICRSVILTGGACSGMGSSIMIRCSCGCRGRRNRLPGGEPMMQKSPLFRFVFCLFENLPDGGVHERFRGEVAMFAGVFFYDLPTYPGADIAGRAVGHAQCLGTFPYIIFCDIGIGRVE